MIWHVYDALVDGEVVYVGCTRDLKRRLQFHKAKGTLPRAALLRVHSSFQSRDYALLAERDRIAALSPPLNRHHNPRYSPPTAPLPVIPPLTPSRKRAIQADARKIKKAADAWAALNAEYTAKIGVTPTTIYNHFPKAVIAALREGEK
jgi:hypothetical protein